MAALKAAMKPGYPQDPPKVPEGIIKYLKIHERWIRVIFPTFDGYSVSKCRKSENL
jgi:hypothetical protein